MPTWIPGCLPSAHGALSSSPHQDNVHTFSISLLPVELSKRGIVRLNVGAFVNMTDLPNFYQ
jgi:hypothetical protein